MPKVQISAADMALLDLINNPRTYKLSDVAHAETLVDGIGKLKAIIADLTEREATLKGHLIDKGLGAYNGELYRATVSQSTRNDPDDVLRAKSKALLVQHTSPQFRSAHTITSTVRAVRVVARVRDQKDEA